MPIIVGDDNQASVVDIKGQATSVSRKKKGLYSPKFFHKSILTGHGGQSRGLLNEQRDPKMYPQGYPNQNVNPNMEYGTHYNKDLKIYNLPCFIMTPSLWDAIDLFDRPTPSEMVKIAVKNTEEIWLWMPIHAVQIEERHIPGPPGSSTTSTEKDLSACFHMFLFSIKDHSSLTHKSVTTVNALGRDGNRFHQDIVWNMFTSLRSLEDKLTQLGYFCDRDAMNDFVQQYSLYTELCRAAERWMTQADYYIADVMVKNLTARTNGKLDPIWTNEKFSAADVLGRLEKYSIPLDQYQSMYTKMAAIAPPDVLSAICKSNLNLRLSNTLHHMHQNRAQLQFVPCNTHIQTTIPYSIEQRNALESTSPLTLVQSGAGTGKSSVILGRIDHMIANGVDPSDITVLSFTNAAANHITDLKPSVHSMTIAAMLHTIYSANHPTHQLSSLSTIINSLDIYFSNGTTAATLTQQQSQFIYDFKYVLERLRDNNEVTRANNFVEDHIGEVIDALDTIGQTSLELESIVCYQCMDTLIEPPETRTKHLIIDEVQDNSIAEFIYSIKYTDKHLCSMYIVGDCSQTLYEFRSSDPKALNVLENSGVFEIHKLQTNYRSNQEILDFANVLLGTIEANQYANIQLRANSLRPVTLQSFKDAVTIHYSKLPNKGTQIVDDMISHSIAVDTRDYISAKLAAGEQVAVLAPTRKIIAKVQNHLASVYPGKKIVSMVPQRQKDSALFSKFIAKYWDQIQYTPPVNILLTIRRELVSRIPYMTGYKSQNVIQKTQDIAIKMMDAFEAQYKPDVLNWQNQVAMSVMTTAAMLDEVKKLMISFEIKRNAAAQAVISNRNAEAKKAADIDDADFVLSTIHSAKGLEFDNVVVYYENNSQMDEPDKRKYYVAFTRAKKSEFIFAYDTAARPKIQGDYDRIIKALEEKDKAAAVAAAAGNSPDTDTSATNDNDATDTESHHQDTATENSGDIGTAASDSDEHSTGTDDGNSNKSA